MKKYLILFSLLLLASAWKPAFGQVIDRIVAVIGEDIILESDLTAQMDYYIANGEKDDGTLRCRVLEKRIIELLLLNKAKQDSIVVTDDEVSQEVDSRIDQFCQMYGGCEKLEEIYKKSIPEIREELRPDIKKQMLVERQRSQIYSSVSVTPREVKKFFNGIPADSLPYMPAEVELYHLSIRPVPSVVEKSSARNRMEGIRKDIVDGKTTFAEMAGKYSMDPGSAKVGGKLPDFGRGQMVPEFEGMVFNMREGDLSPVFETEYGYHIIQLHKRVGEMITASHILIKPNLTSTDDSVAIRRLRQIRSAILADSVTFEKAAILWSKDDASKSCGGCIKNPQTGDVRIPLDMLDVDFFFKVDKMNEGQISEISEWISPAKEKQYHILYLKKRIPPHLASLEKDYQSIRDAAIQVKQFESLENWFNTAKKNIFIEIKDTECAPILTNWIE